MIAFVLRLRISQSAYKEEGEAFIHGSSLKEEGSLCKAFVNVVYHILFILYF